MKLQQIFTLDSIDILILKTLQQNSRTTYCELSELTSLSDVAVKNRIKSLINHKVIEQFTIKLNDKINLTNGTVTITFSEMQDNNLSIKVLSDD